MTDHDYTPIYQYEDEQISVRIGKPGLDDGAFLALNGNIQSGFLEDQYQDMLLPLLRAIREESIEGTFKFYRWRNGEYRLQSYAIMIVMDNQTGQILQNHAQKILDALNVQ
jgi:hypothetical protein